MRTLLVFLGLLAAGPLWAETLTLAPGKVTEWKSVYGRVEARETVPARARIGGLVVELLVSEGDLVTAGQRIAMVRDDKIAFQIAALDARIEALRAQLATAETELVRGQALIDRGVATVQRLDQLRTNVEVLHGQINSTEAERAVILQQSAEGEVLAPGAGRVLTVPATPGAVVLAGEGLATIGGGGFFLRLAIPERHATNLTEGDEIRMDGAAGTSAGRIAKIYPQIENGRVIADVDVDGLDTAFVNARVLVNLPVGEREALLLPVSAVTTRSGIDFVTVLSGEDETERAVLLGHPFDHDGRLQAEVLSGLVPGDRIVTP